MDFPDEINTFKGSEEIELPIDGVLDLHTFNPAEIKDLVPDYLEECRKRDILHVRVIHGKGKGILKQRVLSILSRLPYVVEARADTSSGNWGVTIVTLESLRE